MTTNKNDQKIYHILSIISGIITLLIMIKIITSYPSEYAVGERFVLDEFTFSTPLYTFHFKPITLFIIFSFLWWALGLESWKIYIEKIPYLTRKLIFIFLSLASFIMCYEFLQNFLMWTSFFILYGGNIDQLYHQLNPAMPQPVNFNFVSKIFILLLSGSLYGMYFFNSIKKKD